jgi:hypothetical protein
MREDDQARLAIALTSVLRATEAKNHLCKAAIAFTQSAKNGTPLDVETTLARIDEALNKFAEAMEEARVFRNIVRDDRSKHVKDMARIHARDPWRYRDLRGQELPRHQRDPQAIIDRMLNREPKKRPA